MERSQFDGHIDVKLLLNRLNNISNQILSHMEYHVRLMADIAMTTTTRARAITTQNRIQYDDNKARITSCTVGHVDFQNTTPHRARKTENQKYEKFNLELKKNSKAVNETLVHSTKILESKCFLTNLKNLF